MERPEHFVSRSLQLIAACGLFAIAFPPTLAQAQPTTYTYTGGAIFLQDGLTCPPVCKITGSFTTTEPLPPNYFNVAAPVQSFTFTNGLGTATNASATAAHFDIGTDAEGRINFWLIRIASPSPGNLTLNGQQVPFQYFQMTNQVGDSTSYGNSFSILDVTEFLSGTWIGGSANCPANESNVFPIAGGNKSVDGEPTAMLATFSPSTSDAPTSLAQAAAACGVAEFDWQQTVDDSPFDFLDGKGNRITTPFSDPPPAGYKYMLGNPLYASFFNAYPFYYNPTIVPTGCAINNSGAIGACNLPITSSNGQALNFFDSPRDPGLPAGEYFAFSTRLVGVMGDGSVGPTFFEWTWISTYNETTGGVAQTASAVPVNGSGRGGVTVTSINGVLQAPSTVSCSALPSILWPPNGKPVVVTVAGNIVAGTASLVASAYAVLDSGGQAPPSGTVSLTSGGAYSFTIPLIAARDGSDPSGRTYTILVTATDKIGNVGTCSTVVTVPHDQRQ